MLGLGPIPPCTRSDGSVEKLDSGKPKALHISQLNLFGIPNIDTWMFEE